MLVPVANLLQKNDGSKLKAFAWNLSKKIHSNEKSAKVANKINDVLTLPIDNQNDLQKYAQDFIDSGQISQQDFDAYVNNLFTGDLDYQRNLELMNEQMRYNTAEAQKNREWQTEMSNTAYQRQANDLRAAGYNPALVLGGSGASVMSVNTPYTASGNNNGISNGFTSIVSSALSANTQMSKGILGLLGNVFSSYLKSKTGGSTYNFYTKK